MMRVSGEDYLALAERAQSFLLAETFLLATWGPRLVSRRVDLWTMTLDPWGVPLTADPVPAPDDKPRASGKRIIARAGLTLATPEDVRVLGDQLARAVP